MSSFGPRGSLPTGSVHDEGTSPGLNTNVPHPELSNRKNIAAAQRFRIEYKKRHKPWHPALRSQRQWPSINHAPARITWSGTEVANSGIAKARITWTGVEVASSIAFVFSPPARYNKVWWMLAQASHKKKRVNPRRTLRKYENLATPFRITWSGTEVANGGASASRITWSGAEVANGGAPKVRITWTGVEVANSGSAKARLTWTGVEVASSIAVVPCPTYVRPNGVWRLRALKAKKLRHYHQIKTAPASTIVISGRRRQIVSVN